MDSDTLATVLDAVPFPMLVLGADARVLAANPAAEAVFGPMPAGRHYLTVLRQPALIEVIASAMHARENRQTRLDVAGLSRDTSYRVQASPMRSAAVHPSSGTALVLSFEDITDVEQASEIRRDFVANVSHELRTPLTALLGFIETLKGAARDDPVARARFLSIMEREAERMNRLVGDLLHLSRVEAEERLRPTDQIDIAGLIASCIATLRPFAEDAQVVVETRWPDSGVPDSGVADSGVPDSGGPDSGVPDSSVPGSSVPGSGVHASVTDAEAGHSRGQAPAAVPGRTAGQRPDAAWSSPAVGKFTVAPVSPRRISVPGDSDQLTQVFHNLIENAVKYGGPGKLVTVSMDVIARDPGLRGPALRVDVIDRGEGIDAVHIPRLTERFYRVDTHRSREKGGTGLGLAIVKHIVNRHRGRFRIESEPGVGSRFSVFLPLK